MADGLEHRNVVAVVEAGRRAALEIEPRVFSEGTRTAADAAAAIGVALGQIVKSLVFAVDGEPVIALVSGDNRLDEAKLAAAAGGSVADRLDANAVRAATGFPVGGVPPFGHVAVLRCFVDQDLARYAELWAAAGMPTVNFPISFTELCRVTGGTVVPLAR